MMLLIIALLTGQPAAAGPPSAPAAVVDAVPSPDLPSRRATVPLLPPTLEFWLDAEADRQAVSPVPPTDLRARARTELGPRGTGPGAESLISATVSEVYTRALTRRATTDASRATIQGYLAQNTPAAPSQD